MSKFFFWTRRIKNGSWATFALLAGLLGLSGWFYHDSILLYQSFNHAWAQADWLAIALNYKARGYDFFRPATFNLLTDDGVTGAGFPLPAYLTALLMGLCGHEAPGLMRALTLAASLGGMLALFGLIRRASGSAAKGMLAALFAFCSPIYVFYQANFLPSVPAFAAALAGYYWLYKALEEQNGQRVARRRLAMGVGWLALAAAMRTPFALPLLCSLGQVAVLRHQRTAATVGWKAVSIIFGTAFLVLGADFCYNTYLGHAYHGSLFLMQPRPFASWEQAVEVTKTVREYWLWSLLSKPQWLLLIAAMAAVVHQERRWLLRSDWFGHWLALLAGGLVYYGLMGQQYAIHDYYLLDTFFLPLVFGFGGCLVVLRPAYTRPVRQATAAVALVCCSVAAWLARAEQLRRISPPATDKSVLTRENFLTSARWLDSLGVPRTATLLVLDAYSYNLPLLLAQRWGWTMLKNRNSPQDLSPDNLRRAMALPADYVVTQNATYGPVVVNIYPRIAAYLRPIASNSRLTLWRRRAVPLEARWQLRTDLEAPLDSARWLNTGGVTAGAAASGRLAARLAGGPAQGLTYRQSVGELQVRTGEQLLLAAKYQAHREADAYLVASLGPINGGAYWQQAVACHPTRPGDWEPLGAAFTVPQPHAPTDVLQVRLMKKGTGEVAMDDLEMSILPRE